MAIRSTGPRPRTLTEPKEPTRPDAAATSSASATGAAAPAATSTYAAATADDALRDATVGNAAAAQGGEPREATGQRLDYLSEEQRQKTLREAGVSQEWISAATPEQRREALIDVEQARQRGGQADLRLPTLQGWTPGHYSDSQEIHPTAYDVPGSASFHTDGQGRVAATADGPHQELTSTTALRAQAERDAQPWPGGTPEARVQTRFEPGGDPNSVTGTAARSDKVETVLAALPPQAREEARALLERRLESDPGGAVTDESLDKAFQSVLEARKTPGQKDLDLELVTRSRTVIDGESTYVEQHENRQSFKAQLDVSADGKVNGEPLGVDVRARLASELKTVPQELKDQSLLDAGLSHHWLQTATPLDKDNALARLREASTKPGTHDLDFSLTREWVHGENEQRETSRIDGKLSLAVDDDGKVNGKTPLIETALATQLQMEALPMAEKRAMMGSLGFDAEAQRNARPDQAAGLLTRAALATQTPGEHQLEVGVGGDKYALGLKVGEGGQLEGAGTAKIPPPKKQSFLKKVLPVVLAIAAVIPSPIQPFAAVASGVINGGQALKNGNYLGAVASFAGAGGAVAGLAGNAGLASTLGTVSAVAGATDGIVQSVRSGDVAGLFSSVIAGAATAGNLAGTPISSDLARLGTVVSTANAVAHGDIAGAIGGIYSLAQAAGSTGAEPEPVQGAMDAPGADSGPLPAAGEPALVDGGAVAETFAVDAGGEMVSTPLPPLAPGRPSSRTVAPNETLSDVARDVLGDANRWPELYEYNRDLLGGDPNLVRAGTELRVPPDGYALTAAQSDALHAQAHLRPPPPVVAPLVAPPETSPLEIADVPALAAASPSAPDEDVGPAPPAATDTGLEGTRDALQWVAAAQGLKATVADALSGGRGPGAIGAVSTVLSAGVNALDASLNESLTTDGKAAAAVGATAVDLAIAAAARGNLPFLVVDGALKLLDPVAAHALGLTGENGTLKLSEMLSPTAQVSGVLNNVVALADHAFNDNPAALAAAYERNVSGRNGVFMQQVTRLADTPRRAFSGRAHVEP